MKILVTGGTGFLGQHLAAALLQRGHTVSILGRNFTSAQPLLAQGAVPIACDLRDQTAIHAACAGMDVVYHVGALSAPWGKRADFFVINVDGTAAVLDGCRMHNVRRCIYVSSPSVLFNGHDQWNVSDETAYPARFTSVYALTKKRGEDLVRAATDLHTVILRPKAIFGPGDQTLLPRLIEAARRRRLPQIGTGHNLVDLTYVDNVVHALLLSLESKAPSGKTHLITNNEHIPLWDVIRRTLSRLHLPTQLRHLPLPVVLSAASLMELRAMFDGKEPLMTRYSALILARTQTYDISSAQRDLGYAPIVSVAEGLERTLATLQVEGTRTFA
jgi:2-alkyl-3-oxoalkanoate reductase